MSVNRKKRAEKNRKKIMSLGFIFVMLIFLLVNAIIPDRAYAGKEYRELASMPALTVEGLKDGSYMEGVETYLTDQFNGHNKLTRIRARISLMLGIRESGGVYKGKNGYLLEEIKKADETTLNTTLSEMTAFEERYPKIPMYVMLVPNAANVLSDKLPSHVKVEDQNEQFDTITTALSADYTVVNVTDTLKKHKDEQIYFHTDEHWTPLGAYCAFQQLASDMGLKESLGISYNTYAVSNTFTGSLAGLSGFERGYTDDLYIYVAANDGGAVSTVTDYNGLREDSATMYDTSKLDTENQYNLFFGGNYPFMDVRTTADTTDRLLLIKSSYANCFIPFLTTYYREIVVVDPEYYEDNVNDLMSQYKFTDVLFLYDGNTFVTDTNLSGVLTYDETE